MKIVYLCNFNLNNYSGKDRATRQKLDALEDLVQELKVFSLKKNGNLYKLIKGLILDIQCSYYILTEKPDIFISRGSTGFLSFLASKVSNVTSVREVHALAQNETKHLKFNNYQKVFISGLAKTFHKLDCLVDIRIFNHPMLLTYYKSQGWTKCNDFYSYNGYSKISVTSINKSNAKEKFSLDPNKIHLVFTGSVSDWHGAEYLVSLQEEFDKHGDNILIVVGGGSLNSYDPKRKCLNITPLDDVGCSELINAADACLLPVKNNRISPGSPLKLYDYIAHNKPIIAQSILGYSDEVKKYKFGISVDFSDAIETRIRILSYINKLEFEGFNPNHANVQWKDRMSIWVNKLNKTI